MGAAELQQTLVELQNIATLPIKIVTRVEALAIVSSCDRSHRKFKAPSNCAMTSQTYACQGRPVAQLFHYLLRVLAAPQQNWQPLAMSDRAFQAFSWKGRIDRAAFGVSP